MKQAVEKSSGCFEGRRIHVQAWDILNPSLVLPDTSDEQKPIAALVSLCLDVVGILLVWLRCRTLARYLGISKAVTQGC